jgi:hypothetical protein
MIHGVNDGQSAGLSPPLSTTIADHGYSSGPDRWEARDFYPHLALFSQIITRSLQSNHSKVHAKPWRKTQIRYFRCGR